MTDHELLESAARAAWVKYDPEKSKPHHKSGAFWGLWLELDGEPTEYQRRHWNPLTDDGDALRLAAKLYLWEALRLAHRDVSADVDIYAATRRAIVRAAAAIDTQKEGA